MVFLQITLISSLHLLAGLPCHLFLLYGLQLVIRAVHWSSWKRLTCAVHSVQDHFPSCVLNNVSDHSLTRMSVFLSLYVMFTILFSILVSIQTQKQSHKVNIDLKLMPQMCLTIWVAVDKPLASAVHWRNFMSNSQWLIRRDDLPLVVTTWVERWNFMLSPFHLVACVLWPPP